jgi:quercetin dioxygenase-like cupin family protein
VAYVLVLTGEIVYLVDREEVRLKAGDLVVERGTYHSWRNEGDTPVGWLVTLVSAEA